MKYSFRHSHGGQDGSDLSLDDTMKNIRRELVRRVAVDDRDSNRNVYNALKNE